jgi:hypothetical protein
MMARTPFEIDLSQIRFPLPGKAKEAHQTTSGILVVMDWTNAVLPEVDRNICLFEPSGKLIWTIQKPPKPGTGTGPNPFAGCRYDAGNDEWVGITVSGNQYLIDMKDGSISFKMWSR